jgi:hypothetical protein
MQLEKRNAATIRDRELAGFHRENKRRAKVDNVGVDKLRGISIAPQEDIRDNEVRPGDDRNRAIIIAGFCGKEDDLECKMQPWMDFRVLHFVEDPDPEGGISRPAKVEAACVRGEVLECESEEMFF